MVGGRSLGVASDLGDERGSLVDHDDGLDGPAGVVGAPTATTTPLPPTRVTVTVKPLYVDWDLGDGGKRRCFDPGTIYNPNLPLSTQAPECSKHTYVRPFDEVTIKAAVTYGTMARVEAPNQPPREEPVGVQVARDELKVSVNELQALNPGVSLGELFPPDAEGQVPDQAQIQLPPSDTPSEQREGEYFPDPPSGWDRFKDIGGTILKGASVLAVGVGVALAVGAICATGIGCVLLVGAAAGLAAGATAGGLFCGATLECIGKGALAGGVAGIAAAGAGLAAVALGAGALTTVVIGGGAAGFAGNLTDQLLGGGPRSTRNPCSSAQHRNDHRRPRQRAPSRPTRTRARESAVQVRPRMCRSTPRSGRVGGPGGSRPCRLGDDGEVWGVVEDAVVSEEW